MSHIPVLLKETIDALDPKPGEFFVEGTVGGGGHTEEILKKMDLRGKYLAVDLDKDRLSKTKNKLEKALSLSESDLNIYWFQANFREIKEIIEEKDLDKIDGLLLDLGFSSFQLSSGKGFTFQKDEPLIMRYDGDVEGFTAARLLNEFNKEKISKILKDYGEERRAKKIAHSIVKRRKSKPFRTTGDLVEAIEEVVPKNKQRIHPATKTFMAIRIFINEELESLRYVLNYLPDITKKGARVAIISFHSLEDRIIKNEFKKMHKSGKAKLINKKIIKPGDQEIKNNPRSRSAKLRAIKFN